MNWKLSFFSFKNIGFLGTPKATLTAIGLATASLAGATDTPTIETRMDDITDPQTISLRDALALAPRDISHFAPLDTISVGAQTDAIILTDTDTGEFYIGFIDPATKQPIPTDRIVNRTYKWITGRTSDRDPVLYQGNNIKYGRQVKPSGEHDIVDLWIETLWPDGANTITIRLDPTNPNNYALIKKVRDQRWENAEWKEQKFNGKEVEISYASTQSTPNQAITQYLTNNHPWSTVTNITDKSPTIILADKVAAAWVYVAQTIDPDTYDLSKPVYITVQHADGSREVIKTTLQAQQAPNTAPVARADSFSAEQGKTITGNVLSNDTDSDGDRLTVTSHTQPAHGSLTIAADGTMTYESDDSFVGTVTATYTIDDGKGDTATGTISFTMTATPNAAPTAQNDTATVQSWQSVVIDALSNDTDANGDTLTNTGVVTPPQHGTVTKNTDGTFSYTADAGFVGTDTFTYRISDGKGGTSTATVTITVTATPNQAPTINDATLSGNEGETVSIDLSTLASDSDGTIKDYNITPQGNAPTATLNGTILSVILPRVRANKIYKYTITAIDNQWATSTPGTITIENTNVPAPAPSFVVPDTIKATKGETVRITGLNFQNVENITLTTEDVEISNINVDIANGVITFDCETPGEGTLTYTATNTEGLSTTKTSKLSIAVPTAVIDLDKEKMSLSVQSGQITILGDRVFKNAYLFTHTGSHVGTFPVKDNTVSVGTSYPVGIYIITLTTADNDYASFKILLQ